MNLLRRRDLIAGGIATAALATPIACLAQTEWVCPIIVAYANGAPIRITVRYGNGPSELAANKAALSAAILRETPSEIVAELRLPPLGSSAGFLRIDKNAQRCQFSQTQP